MHPRAPAALPEPRSKRRRQGQSRLVATHRFRRLGSAQLAGRSGVGAHGDGSCRRAVAAGWAMLMANRAPVRCNRAPGRSLVMDRRQFFGDSVAGTLIRLVLLSVVVGVVFSALGITPAN